MFTPDPWGRRWTLYFDEDIYFQMGWNSTTHTSKLNPFFAMEKRKIHGDWTNQFDLENQPVKVWSNPIDKVNHFKEPGTPTWKVPFLLGNWIAGFRGFKLMEIHVATAGNPRQLFKVRFGEVPIIGFFTRIFGGKVIVNLQNFVSETKISLLRFVVS